MALHHELPIYKAAYDLLGMALDVTRNIPRDFKRLIGEKVREECVEILVLIFRANVARHKVPHIKPWRRSTRRRTLRQAIHRVRTIPAAQLYETTNSYYGQLRQASHSHHDRVRLTKAVFQRGKAVNADLTKIFRGTHEHAYRSCSVPAHAGERLN